MMVYWIIYEMDKVLDLVLVTIRVIDFMECDSDVKK